MSEATKLAQALTQANATFVTALRQKLSVLASDIFKEAAETPFVKWERDFGYDSMSSGPWRGSSEKPSLRWNTNATERVKHIIKSIDETANPEDFLQDARLIIKEETDVLLGKSGLSCWVSSGSTDYIKKHGLPEECKSKLVNVNLTCRT